MIQNSQQPNKGYAYFLHSYSIQIGPSNIINFTTCLPVLTFSIQMMFLGVAKCTMTACLLVEKGFTV